MLVGATALRHCWGWAIQFSAVSAKSEVETMSNLEIILSRTIDGLQRGSEDILNRRLKHLPLLLFLPQDVTGGCAPAKQGRTRRKQKEPRPRNGASDCSGKGKCHGNQYANDQQAKKTRGVSTYVAASVTKNLGLSHVKKK